MRSAPWDELNFWLDLRIFLRNHYVNIYHPPGASFLRTKGPASSTDKLADKLVCHCAAVFGFP